MTGTLYHKLKCKECDSTIGYYPYTNKNEAVILFNGRFLCITCKTKKTGRKI